MADKPKRTLLPHPTAFLQQIGPGRSFRTYRNKEVIYSQGGPADAVFYLQSGMVKLVTGSKNRHRKAVLSVLYEGDLFGEGCLGQEVHRRSTAISVGPSTITRLEKASFRRKLDRDPVFAGILITWLLAQANRLKSDLADHFLSYSERRLARILLQNSIAQQSQNEPSTIRLSQAALAEMVGTTRSRVSSFMNEFRKKGYVRYNGSLEVDTRRLTAFLQD
jgi:CRP-like cAMP-binding protein